MGIGTEALKKVLTRKPGSVLDVGCGRGIHARRFKDAGWTVDGIDILPAPGQPFDRYFQGFWQDFQSRPTYDCVWASHVLEHQINVGSFLRFCRDNVKPGGLLAVTVPPMKHNIVGGHLSMWNMGLLLYNMILAGIDCKEAQGLKYGYNISVIAPFEKALELPDLHYDKGDIELLAPFFPKGHKWAQNFHGDLENINWR